MAFPREMKWGGRLLLFLVMAAIFAPWLTLERPEVQSLAERLAGPSAGHWMGTDELGRDVWARMIHGARVSLGVGTLAIVLSTFIGVLMGAIAGAFGGWIDAVIMRAVDILLCIPSLYLVLALIVFLGPGIVNVVIVIALTGWTDMARLVRAEILSLREREFVLAARAAGAGPFRLIFRHLLPNALGPVYVSVTFGVAGAIMLESSLSFLGLGVQPPTPSWGNLLTSGKDYFQLGAWWLVVFPGAAICGTMLLIYLFGEGLREYTNPKGS
jgi:peptide/nickel transport system permease protein